MNRIIGQYVSKQYGFDVLSATPEDLQRVTEIIVRDRTMSRDDSDWDFSAFPNLTKIDCSYNPIEKLKISENSHLEEIDFSGARGSISQKIDFTGNPHLKSVSAGQDGVIELDFSGNQELERLSVVFSQSLRWINLDNCVNLKKILLRGVIIPFVDLTHCINLSEVSIDYMNLYRNKSGEYGPGFPRPIVFVNEDFDESVIDAQNRKYEYYAYYLVRVKPDSAEERFLTKVKSMKDVMLDVPSDRIGEWVARLHYALLDIYNELKREKP